jgi:hypothetical protein
MSRRIVVIAVVAGLSALLVGGCSSGDPALHALESDPLVTAKVDRFTETQLFGQIDFTSLGKHQPATLTRLLKTGTRHVTDDDLRATAQVATKDGWDVSLAENGTWRGTKLVDGRPVDIWIRRSFSSTEGRLIAIVLTDTSS